MGHVRNLVSDYRRGDTRNSMRVKHNKQHDARAASFKRIAKAIRKAFPTKDARLLAKIFDDEAKLLRSMR